MLIPILFYHEGERKPALKIASPFIIIFKRNDSKWSKGNNSYLFFIRFREAVDTHVNFH